MLHPGLDDLPLFPCLVQCTIDIAAQTRVTLKRYKQDGNVFTQVDEDKRQAVSP